MFLYSHKRGLPQHGARSSERSRSTPFIRVMPMVKEASFDFNYAEQISPAEYRLRV
jgi:hypothetical protein